MAYCPWTMGLSSVCTSAAVCGLICIYRIYAGTYFSGPMCQSVLSSELAKADQARLLGAFGLSEVEVVANSPLGAPRSAASDFEDEAREMKFEHV